jgi:hypothetical protein
VSPIPPAERVVVLRLDPGAADWLAVARGRAGEAPATLVPLLRGRTRVELSPTEAEAALAWASTVPGWDDDGRPPLFVYDGSVLLAAG